MEEVEDIVPEETFPEEVEEMPLCGAPKVLAAVPPRAALIPEPPPLKRQGGE